MRNPEHTRSQIDPDNPVGRRLNYLDTYIQQMDMPFALQAYIEAGVIPLIEDLSEAGLEGDAADLGSLVEINLGIHQPESRERFGNGPKLELPEKEIQRIYRAGKHASHFGSILMNSFELDGMPGHISLLLQSEEGMISIRAMFDPSTIENETLKLKTDRLNPTDDTTEARRIRKRVAELSPTLVSDNEANITTDHKVKQYLWSNEPSLRPLHEKIVRATNLNQRLGGIMMGTARGYKDQQEVQISEALAHFAATTNLAENYDIVPIGNDRGRIVGYEINAKDASRSYIIGLKLNKPDSDDRYETTDEIVVRKTSGNIPATREYDLVRAELLEDVKVIQGAIDWLYSYSEVSVPETKLSARLRDETIVGNIIRSGIVEVLDEKSVGKGFDELGGRFEEKERFKSLAKSVVSHIQGDGPHPGHAIVYGETGSGKTTLVSATLREIQSHNIPIYRIYSSPDTGKYFAENPDILTRLFLLVSVNGGVIYIPDLDNAVGLDTETKANVEGQLNGLLETTANVPGVFVIADSARPYVILDTLRQAHRLGRNAIEVKKPEAVEELKDIWSKVLSWEQYSGITDPDVNLTAISEDISKFGGLEPARIVAIAENIRTAGKRINQENLSKGFEEAKHWEMMLKEKGEEQREFGWQHELEGLNRRIDEIEEKLSHLEENQTGNSGRHDEEIREIARKVGQIKDTEIYFLDRRLKVTQELYRDLESKIRDLEFRMETKKETKRNRPRKRNRN